MSAFVMRGVGLQVLSDIFADEDCVGYPVAGVCGDYVEVLNGVDGVFYGPQVPHV